MIGREKEFQRIKVLLTSAKTFPAIMIVGPPQTGKSLLLSEILDSLRNEIDYAQVSCLSATIRVADIFENILNELHPEKGQDGNRCSSFSDFVIKMNRAESSKRRAVIVLKNAERLRGLDPLLLPGLIKLNELIPKR